MLNYFKIFVYDETYCPLMATYDEICFHKPLLGVKFPITFIETGYEPVQPFVPLCERETRSLGLHGVREIFMIQESRRPLMNEEEESDVGVRGETGELYLLDKKERRLTIEVLKRTLASEVGRRFLEGRFGKEGLKTALGLLNQMGVQIREQQEQKPNRAS